jgi:hypothetical protein
MAGSVVRNSNSAVHFVPAGVVLVLSGHESADRRSVNDIPEDCFDSKRSIERFIPKLGIAWMNRFAPGQPERAGLDPTQFAGYSCGLAFSRRARSVAPRFSSPFGRTLRGYVRECRAVPRSYGIRAALNRARTERVALVLGRADGSGIVAPRRDAGEFDFDGSVPVPTQFSHLPPASVLQRAVDCADEIPDRPFVNTKLGVIVGVRPCGDDFILGLASSL